MYDLKEVNFILNSVKGHWGVLSREAVIYHLFWLLLGKRIGVEQM